jgi:hypothetical protein
MINYVECACFDWKEWEGTLSNLYRTTLEYDISQMNISQTQQ